MITAFTLGALLFGVALIALYFLTGYMRSEGFDNVPASLFVPQVTPGGADERSLLSPNGVSESEKLLANGGIPAMPTDQALANWGKLNSERCYRADIGESLKLTRNYLQRTNNYQRTHPDSCSAPNHELIGTFYTPFEGVGRTPASGANYPASTQCRE